ncbi:MULTISPECIES: hypothetical protein [Tatumella]|uniref:Uncharacterized protein n=2 Tax=Tatumella ptyseos TaxID=82987 RepID=A0A085JFC0_9GAMM|nr:MULTISPECIES: hypothetical protein [Tatumella]KFD19166.1 hypothetical protein GTPT_1953 [Tatumella ptyseos ATCC 33301]SQK75291.1 Uncharacterised protein [Tatumella ptyseos]
MTTGQILREDSRMAGRELRQRRREDRFIRRPGAGGVATVVAGKGNA